MKEVILFAMCIVLSPNFTGVHEVDFQDHKRILLEARYSSRGMQSWMDGEHLIARIYSDGVVEYEDVEIKNGVANGYFRQAALSKEEIGNLSELLKSNDVQGLSNEYSAFTTTIDHTEDLLLKITTNNLVKEIVVKNFKPDLPKVSMNYPKPLVRVACWAELSRKNAQARFFFRESTTCVNILE